MDIRIRRHLTEFIHLGEMTVHRELAVVPIMSIMAGGPDYITLKEAFALSGFSVSEISENGSVPNLKATNKTGSAVLLLDGEELAGAKQNRVINTSILIADGTSAVIPVSCTEQGRWRYTSDGFAESGTIMPRTIRSLKNASVTSSVRHYKTFFSDQNDVWDGIDRFHKSHGTSSDTSAMKDAYESRKEHLEQYRGNFSLHEGQCGMAVMIKGKVAGIEFLSRSEAYRQVHEKLLGSYIMDIPLTPSDGGDPELGKVLTFIEEICESTEERIPSVGIGDDCRFNANALVGSALLVADRYVHAAFFRSSEKTDIRNRADERMASMSRRRASRTTQR